MNPVFLPSTIFLRDEIWEFLSYPFYPFTINGQKHEPMPGKVKLMNHRAQRPTIWHFE